MNWLFGLWCLFFGHKFENYKYHFSYDSVRKCVKYHEGLRCSRCHYIEF